MVNVFATAVNLEYLDELWGWCLRDTSIWPHYFAISRCDRWILNWPFSATYHRTGAVEWAPQLAQCHLYTRQHDNDYVCVDHFFTKQLKWSSEGGNSRRSLNVASWHCNQLIGEIIRRDEATLLGRICGDTVRVSKSKLWLNSACGWVVRWLIQHPLV